MNWFFSFQEFMTRDHCGLGWSPELVFFYQLANFLIATAYFLIPVNLLIFWSKRKSITPKPWIILMFASFIGLCGLTHVTDIMVFYFPMYRFFSVIFMATGIISIITAVLLPGVLASFIAMTAGEVDRLSAELDATKSHQVKLQELMKLLQNQNDILTDQIKSRMRNK